MPPLDLPPPRSSPSAPLSPLLSLSSSLLSLSSSLLPLLLLLPQEHGISHDHPPREETPFPSNISGENIRRRGERGQFSRLIWEGHVHSILMYRPARSVPQKEKGPKCSQRAKSGNGGWSRSLNISRGSIRLTGPRIRLIKTNTRAHTHTYVYTHLISCGVPAHCRRHQDVEHRTESTTSSTIDKDEHTRMLFSAGHGILACLATLSDACSGQSIDG